jgi:tRNA modification GTPase
LRPQIKSDLKNKKIILVRSKIDLKKNPGKLADMSGVDLKDICETSAKTGKGIKKLEKTLFSELQKINSGASVFVTNLRHKKLLEKALKSLRATQKLAQNNEAEDKILIELNTSREALEEIIGEKITGDILEKVFSRFCVGK